jgi:hypothetical protein
LKAFYAQSFKPVFPQQLIKEECSAILGDVFFVISILRTDIPEAIMRI